MFFTSIYSSFTLTEYLILGFWNKQMAKGLVDNYQIHQGQKYPLLWSLTPKHDSRVQKSNANSFV